MRILIFFTSALACCYLATMAIYNANWYAFYGWTVAALFAVIICLLFIINPRLKTYDEQSEPASPDEG